MNLYREAFRIEYDVRGQKYSTETIYGYGEALKAVSILRADGAIVTALVRTHPVPRTPGLGSGPRAPDWLSRLTR